MKDASQNVIHHHHHLIVMNFYLFFFFLQKLKIVNLPINNEFFQLLIGYSITKTRNIGIIAHIDAGTFL